MIFVLQIMHFWTALYKKVGYFEQLKFIVSNGSWQLD